MSQLRIPVIAAVSSNYFQSCKLSKILSKYLFRFYCMLNNTCNNLTWLINMLFKMFNVIMINVSGTTYV